MMNKYRVIALTLMFLSTLELRLLSWLSPTHDFQYGWMVFAMVIQLALVFLFLVFGDSYEEAQKEKERDW